MDTSLLTTHSVEVGLPMLPIIAVIFDIAGVVRANKRNNAQSVQTIRV